MFQDIDTGIELKYGIEELEGWDDIRYEMYWRRILNGEDTSHPGMRDLDLLIYQWMKCYNQEQE